MRKIASKTNAEGPSGTTFIVDRGPFRYGEQIDVAVFDLAEDKILNWPMVYILANDISAYVGQTTSVATRITQHGASEEKRDFTTVNIIFNAEMFDDLWDELKRLDLVDHTINEIEESEVFKYSPYKGLTIDQRVALDKIMEAIEGGLENAEPIVVQGMPGTGKTVLAVYLLKMLRDDSRFADMNIRIMEPVTSLRHSLQDSLKGVSGLSQDDIIAPGDLAKEDFGYTEGKKCSFDIVLVDEAHKLKQRVNLGTQFGNYDKINVKLGLPKDSTQMDWIINQVRLPIFFYDPLQAVGPSCLSPESIAHALALSVKDPICLDSQMRVKGGREYLEYIADILAGKNPQPRDFDDYDLVLHDDFVDFIDSFEKNYLVHSLSRMIAGYAWKWKTKGGSDSEIYDIEYGDIGLRWNCTYDNWVGKGFNDISIAHEVGCIHSIQGYDLSYAYVLIGNDIEIDDETGTLRANRDSYYDTNGKNTASQEELTQYIKNIYYVLLTRGIFGTHVYIADEKLREYLSKFFPLAV